MTAVLPGVKPEPSTVICVRAGTMPAVGDTVIVGNGDADTRGLGLGVAREDVACT